MLNTRALTFFDLDWLNEEAAVRVCKRCGFLHWFIEPPKANTSELIRCTHCNKPLAWGATHCEGCGEARPADELY